jgi:hypothetical protein
LPSVPRRDYGHRLTGHIAPLVILACACVALAACGGLSTTSGGAAACGSEAFDDSASIEVPDVSGENGSSAVSDVEDAGLTA